MMRKLAPMLSLALVLLGIAAGCARELGGIVIPPPGDNFVDGDGESNEGGGD